MFNTIIQLYIESKLSGAKPYLASHPELGVPLGVFNYKDEPNREARIKSIKKYGTKGNPQSYKLAKKYGIEDPLPSYQQDDQEKIKELERKIQQLERDQENDFRSSAGSGNNLLTSKTQLFIELEKEVRQTNLTMGETIGLINKVAMGGAQDRILAFRELNALADGFRTTLTTTIGQTQGMMTQTTQAILAAGGEMEGFALTSNDVLDTMTRTMESVGRQLMLPPEVMAEMTKIDDLFGEISAEFVSNFDKIGSGAIQATQAINHTVQTAMNMGLTVSKLLPEVEKNITKINTYGFQNGVQGLTKMVAQGQRLGMTMGEVLKVSDKAFTPEGAIDMAAQLQMIGGAASEMLDPFQLMYMAQNDVEGLQDAIVKSTESAVTFNEQTGEFGIPPSERMRLQKTADAMGLSYETLAETAVRNAKRTQAMAQFEVGGNIDEDTKELIASMSDIGADGKAQISLLDETGETVTYALEDLNKIMATNPQLLEDIRKQAEQGELSMDDINQQQLTVSKAVAANVADINNILIAAAANGAFGDPAVDIATAIQDMRGPEVFGENAVANIANVSQNLNLSDQMINDIQGGIDEADRIKVTKANDFLLEPGSSLETAGPGGLIELIQPAAGDTIMGGTDVFNSFYNQKSSIANMNTNNMAGGGGGGQVKLTGTLELKLDGKSMNVSADDIFRALSPPSYERLALELSNTVFGAAT